MKSDPKEKKRWLDDPRSGRMIFWVLFGVCVALVAADLLYHKHAHFDWEGWFGFHGFFGFVSFFLLVLAGKQLRRILMRDEDYYDR